MRDRSQIQTYGKVLTDQTVGILIGRPLPGAVRIGEIDVDLQLLGKYLVARHLLALIVGQRVLSLQDAGLLERDDGLCRTADRGDAGGGGDPPPGRSRRAI